MFELSLNLAELIYQDSIMALATTHSRWFLSRFGTQATESAGAPRGQLGELRVLLHNGLGKPYSSPLCATNSLLQKGTVAAERPWSCKV